MANILPVSDLRNYNEVLKNCHKGEPVYLTKNGRGRFVVMDIEDYERDRAEKKLLMANILPVSDLRNYNEVLKNCHKGEPVYLTKNGRGRFVVMDIEDYERDRAEKKLLMKLQEAEEAVKDGEGWLDLDELKALVGE